MIIGINRNAVFSLDEARELLPIVFRITKSYHEQVNALIAKLESLERQADTSSKVSKLESEINKLIQEWQNKIQKLGAQPKGLWVADFDSGKGYYCWKYPERTIEFWHRYSDGFSKRIHVDSLTNVSFIPQVAKYMAAPEQPLQN